MECHGLFLMIFFLVFLLIDSPYQCQRRFFATDPLLYYFGRFIILIYIMLNFDRFLFYLIISELRVVLSVFF